MQVELLDDSAMVEVEVMKAVDGPYAQDKASILRQKASPDRSTVNRRYRRDARPMTWCRIQPPCIHSGERHDCPEQRLRATPD
jgi:hypothetical protein